MKRISSVVLILLVVLFSFKIFKKRNDNEVVAYVCLDQVFSEPILKEFEKNTGIKVKAVYDIEATKTTGLTNRLIAEKDNPQCDVFWNNEIARTILLKNKGILSPYFSPGRESIPEEFKDPQGYWTGFAARARVIIYNKDLVAKEEIPQSIFQLINPKWQGKCAVANPLFGTTSTHFTALCEYLGKEKFKKFLQGLKDNDVMIAFGNSVVKDRVVDGEVYWGITDTDDVNVAMEEGKPVDMVFPDQDSLGTLLIPNTVALIKDCPHPENGRKLIDYLLSLEVEKKLAQSESLQIPLHKDIGPIPDALRLGKIKIMPVDFEEVAKHIERYAPLFEKILIK